MAQIETQTLIHQYPLIDTHCHFDAPPFAGHCEEAWAQARSQGVAAMLVPAVSEQNFAAVLALSAQEGIYAALGLHPLFVAQHTESALACLETLLTQHAAGALCTDDGRALKVSAIGEIGLDLWMPEPDLARQITLLRAQLALANRFALPVVLHSRKSHDLLLRELRRCPPARGGVLHGFSGSLQQAQAFVALGLCIGVGGVISYARAQKTRRTVAALPLECLVLETDAPDMPLSGYQGQPNRPERVQQVFQALCELRSESPDYIAEIVYKNSVKMLNL